ncbi:MAG: hypothetical protein MZU79_09355 [Anaerotruncus sp.]|nr:hypothetical protein [Anaerotruncus sp.]
MKSEQLWILASPEDEDGDDDGESFGEDYDVSPDGEIEYQRQAGSYRAAGTRDPAHGLIART